MRRAVLLYNPVSGRSSRRIEVIERVAAAIRQESVEVVILATEGPGTAGKQAAAAAESADVIFACGGDGTVHEVLQGLAFHPTVTLAIIPLGSANVLARHLMLSRDPVRAALQQLRRRPQVVPLGRVQYMRGQEECTRYFAVMAGAGPDGALVYRMLGGNKQWLGRLAYYFRAAYLFARSEFAPFTLRVVEPDKPGTEFEAVSAMTVRVGDLGGLFSALAKGSLEDPHLSLTAIIPPGRWTLPTWFAMSWLRASRWNAAQRVLRAQEFYCGPGRHRAVQVQADGEWLGRTPMSVTLHQDALRLLMP